YCKVIAFANILIKSKLCGKPLCVIVFKVIVCSIAFSFHVPDISTFAFFNSGIDAEVHFSPSLKIVKEPGINIVPFKFWNGCEPHSRRVIGCAAVSGGQQGNTCFVELSAVKPIQVKATGSSSVKQEPKLTFVGWGF